MCCRGDGASRGGPSSNDTSCATLHAEEGEDACGRRTPIPWPRKGGEGNDTRLLVVYSSLRPCQCETIHRKRALIARSTLGEVVTVFPDQAKDQENHSDNRGQEEQFTKAHTPSPLLEEQTRWENPAGRTADDHVQLSVRVRYVGPGRWISPQGEREMPRHDAVEISGAQVAAAPTGR